MKLYFIFGFFLLAFSGEDTNKIKLDKPPKEPPFFGTIFLDPDIITEEDKTTFEKMTYKGTGTRTMYDRRVANRISVTAYLFQVEFDDNLVTEIQVNPEFTQEEAEQEAEKYAIAIGRIPTTLRKDVQTVWIHKGLKLFGGGNNNLLIHTEQGESYIASGILEETFVHEASHTSLDNPHATSAGWKNAQKEDNRYISTYARDLPQREDIAESFLTYLAIRYREDRITTALADTIKQAIPNRIKYFDDQTFNMYPID